MFGGISMQSYTKMVQISIFGGKYTSKTEIPLKQDFRCWKILKSREKKKKMPTNYVRKESSQIRN